MAINYTYVDQLAHIEFASPETGNALSPQIIEEFSSVCERIDKHARAVLITAQGKNFCVGGDLTSIAQADDPGELIRNMADRIHDGILALNRLSVPVVIAAQGSAAGAGLSLVASGDIVFAGETSKYVLAYPQIGFAADGGSSYYLARAIGFRRAQEMVYLGKGYTAEEAVQYGLVTKKVADDALQDEALKTAQRLARGPTLAFKEIKGLYDVTLANNLKAQLDLETEAISKTAGSRDGKEGVRSFFEKRKPKFSGK